MKFNSKQLRKSTPKKTDIQKIIKNPIYIVLDRVIDTYNIGSLFRLADAIAAEKLYICGGDDVEYPPSSRIHKAAVGTEAWVPWTTKSSALEAVKELKKKGVLIIAVEQSPNSIPYTKLGDELARLKRESQGDFYVSIVVGNETNGVSKEVLEQADLIVELPMYGVNKSFNVWGSAAVVAYKILETLL